MKILVASKNDAKINGAKIAFENFFSDVETDGVSVESGVSEQPVNNEIYLGAKNRVLNLVKYAKQNNVKADYFVALESGLTNGLADWQNITICVICDNYNNFSFGTSAGFPIPEKFIDEIKEKSLSTFMAEQFNKNKAEKVNGGISFLTKGILHRQDLCVQAVVMALTQFVNAEWNNFDI